MVRAAAAKKKGRRVSGGPGIERKPDWEESVPNPAHPLLS